MIKQAHVMYSGHVQGVGFRYTCKEIAQEVGIKGWVKNLTDGRVEVVAEAGDDKVQVFLDKIKTSYLGSYISDEKVSWIDGTEGFRDFDVRVF